jgi:hypothetical protein
MDYYWEEQYASDENSEQHLLHGGFELHGYPKAAPNLFRFNLFSGKQKQK